MGRRSYSNRGRVEDCLSVSVKFLHRHHYFDGGIRSGRISWSRRNEEYASIGVLVSIGEYGNYAQFNYSTSDKNTGEKDDINYSAQLVSTSCNWGKYRWWFICPVIFNGQLCGRRVGILYLGDGKYFGCRHCHNLTYRSCQESHKNDGMAKRLGIDPKDLKRMFG